MECCRKDSKYRDLTSFFCIMRQMQQNTLKNHTKSIISQNQLRLSDRDDALMTTMSRLQFFQLGAAALLSASLIHAAHALELPVSDRGKLLATAGVSQAEGAAGGGLVPWAVIAGYGSEDSAGATVFLTQLNTRDYRLRSSGVALGWHDKLEVSLARQEFTGNEAPLDQLRLSQDIVGIKLKLSGDLIADQDNWRPQLAVGAMFKQTRAVEGLSALGVTSVTQLGAADSKGVDYFVSATKLLLANSLLLNGTLRLSKGNQLGLLGFGGPQSQSYQLLPEVSAAYLLSPHWVVGAEYRQRPSNLVIDREKAAKDVFLAYFPNKQLSLTLAYVSLGDITVFNPRNQQGWYLSLQLAN
jgi:hypothetical protein